MRKRTTKATIVTRLNLSLLWLILGSSLLQAGEIGYPVELHDSYSSRDSYMGIRLRGSLVLKGDDRLAELSDLAWDEDKQILYGITDRGVLLHLEPTFENDHLKGMQLLHAKPLKNLRGQRLRRYNRDAEGLFLIKGRNGIRDDSELLISFEHHHRIMRYDTSGAALERLSDNLLHSIGPMERNKGMEALTWHPEFGLISGAEEPAIPGATLSIVSGSGKRWSFTPQQPAGALVALETLPDGGLLVLERAYISPFHPWVISLARIERLQLDRQGMVQPTEIARFNSSEGWRTQNFEGLAWHQGLRFFMASDDNNRPFAETQIIYFELLPN